MSFQQASKRIEITFVCSSNMFVATALQRTIARFSKCIERAEAKLF